MAGPLLYGALMRLNVAHLFPRLSIRAKLVIAFCLFAVLPTAAVGGYGALHAFLLLNENLQERLRAEASLKAEGIGRAVAQAHADVRFLAALPTVRALARAPSEAAAASVAAAWLAFARSRPVYDQLRYLDTDGHEVVRVDARPTGPEVAPAERLQSKRDRYYFAEAMATPPGQVYVSPMDLNLERGQVEEPHKPVVRYAVTVAGDDARPRGVVVVNLHAAHVLREALGTGGEPGHLALASSAGYYLARTPAERTAGGLAFPSWLASWGTREEAARRAPAADRVVADYAPDVAARILSGAPGSVIEPGLHGRIVAFAPVFPRRGPEGEFWVLLQVRDKTQALASLRALQLVAGALGALAVAVALGAGVVAARHFTRPITALARGAEAIARGEFDASIRVETNDELEDLGRQFQRMALDLKAHERRLRDAQVRAERRAREMDALYRVATAVLTLRSLPAILSLVAERARVLLDADVVVLSLRGDGAASGPPIVSGDAVLALATEVTVPLRGAGGELGSLRVGYAAERAMLADEREFLAVLADQAALALEKARLEEQVRALAALEERERIAADLHDGIIQSLYATGLGLEACIALVTEDRAEAAARLREIVDRIDTVVRDVRNYVVGLSPEALRGKSLGDALTDLARDVELNRLATVGITVEPGASGRLSPEATRELFLIGREALANVVKHAPGAQAVIRLARDAGGLALSVEDDGAGFEAPAPGRGLRNIEERARRLGGGARIESVPGKGTRVTVNVPLGGRS